MSVGLAAGFVCAERAAPAVFHVDSEAGNDSAEGTRPDTAWRTLDKVNATALIPGDQILFKRGGLWRGGFGRCVRFLIMRRGGSDRRQNFQLKVDGGSARQRRLRR